MRRIRTLGRCAAALLVGGALACASAPPAGADAATYLPDSAVLARVDNRVIRTYDFRERFFSSDPQSRPGQDSVGRAEFLQSLIDKEVLSLEAIASGRKPNPREELLLRNYQDQLLAFQVFKRRIERPVVMTERDLRELYALKSFELKLRYLLFKDRSVAELVRDQLQRGQISWANAARRFSLGPDSLRESDMGWMTRSNLPSESVAKIFELRPPRISDVLKDAEGYKIWQCLDRRPVPLAPFTAMRRSLVMELRPTLEAPLRAKLFQEMRLRVNPTYDTANVAWLAERFRLANQRFGDSTGFDLRSAVPRMADADTSRVLAEARGMKYTAGLLVDAYRDTPPVGRRRISTVSSLFDMLEPMVLAPAIVEYARSQGLDRDPIVLTEMQKKRESAIVEQLYGDSVEARIDVSDAKRRKYYTDHQREFVTRERVRYAVIGRVTEAGADSVIARLKAGVSPHSILAADSASGWHIGFIRDLVEGQSHTFRNLLFEELRTGESTKMFMSQDKKWAVFYILSHDSPRPMKYEEVVDLVDESVASLAAERLLGDLLKRMRPRHRIEQHPEYVMRVQLIDPADDWSGPTGD